jgi:hypothetical protein
VTADVHREIGELLVEQLDVVDPRRLTAHLVPTKVPGSPDWMGYMTASKIAAVVGLSTYESPFSLWHRMAGNIANSADTDITRRGHYLEPAIRAWFADQHPELDVATTGTWVHNERAWQAGQTSDALVFDRRVGSRTTAGHAAKPARSHDRPRWPSSSPPTRTRSGASPAATTSPSATAARCCGRWTPSASRSATSLS